MAPASGVEMKKEEKDEKENKGKDASKKEEETELVNSDFLPIFFFYIMYLYYVSVVIFAINLLTSMSFMTVTRQLSDFQTYCH